MSTYIKNNTSVKYVDITPLLNEFLRYMITVKGSSPRTANEYYVEIRLFYRYIKMLRDNVPQENYDNILIKDVSNEDISRVTKDDILEYMYFLAKKGNSIRTRGHKLSAVRVFYGYACTAYPETFGLNPAESIERPKVPQRQPKYLKLNEAKDLLEASKQMPNKERDFCITTLLLNCGMRLSELISINISSITGDTLKIVGKGNKERTVYLNESCLSAISEWKETRQTILNIEDKDALFISKLTKKRLTPRAVEKIIEKELKIAGLGGKGFSPHKLRHTAATLMYESGADILELKEILGHEHTTTTEIYTHLNNHALREVSKNNPLNKN